MSGSGYLHWSNDPFEKMVIFPPDPLPLQRGCREGLAINTIAMPLDQASSSTMVMFFFRVGTFFLVGPVLSWRERYLCAKLCFCILCLWMGSSTFREFLGGKVMFLCFYVFWKQACGHPLMPPKPGGTYVSPPHVTTSYGTLGGAVGTQHYNGLSVCSPWYVQL